MSKLTFNRKPMPLFPEYRPIYKISQILLILSIASRGKKSSLIRLHLINWALKDQKRKNILIESANKNRVLFGIWGVDPALNFALQFSLAEHLINKDGASYKIALKGEELVNLINDNNLLEDEYSFLKKLGTKITEGMVQDTAGDWE